MVDEPSLGLAPRIVRQIFDVLRAWVDEHKSSALVVEQNAIVALSHSEHAYVLEVGRVALTGASQKLQNDENVRRSYLGY
jgi:branched-chain amino acid transport system ATP-binding protein